MMKVKFNDEVIWDIMNFLNIKDGGFYLKEVLEVF